MTQISNTWTNNRPPAAVIIGLDVSERRIGYAIAEYDSGVIVETGVLHTPAGDDLNERVRAWHSISHAANQTGDIELVLIEAPWSGPNRQGSIRGAMAVGNLAGIAATRLSPHVLVDTIQPTTWRRICGIPTRGKEPVMQWATQLLGRTITQDEADATGITRAAHHIAWNGHNT